MSDPTGLTATLAHYAAASCVDALPAAVRHEAARALVNWVAVAVGGSGEAAVVTAAGSLANRSGRATVIGAGFRSDPVSAAFVNCIASSVLAYDDAHMPTVAHPSGPATAALLALAQSSWVSGPEFVNALALGIEVQCRIATMLVLPPGPIDTSLYINGFSGPVGVAVAAGRLLGLAPRQMAWAIGIAATQASGFRAVHGTMTSHLRPGHACRTGLEAALLADQGFDCIETALEAAGGFIDVYASGSDPAMALDGLGERHVMLENRYKPYPCGIVIHPVIDACRELRARLPADARIARVRLLVNPLVPRLTGKRLPRTELEAHVSVFHWAAVALLFDDPGLAATRAPCLANAEVAALSERIDAKPVDDMDKGHARVEVVLDDGTLLDAYVVHARGSRARPMTDGELDTKFDTLTGSGPYVAGLRDACWQVEALPDVGETLGALLP